MVTTAGAGNWAIKMGTMGEMAEQCDCGLAGWAFGAWRFPQAHGTQDRGQRSNKLLRRRPTRSGQAVAAGRPGARVRTGILGEFEGARRRAKSPGRWQVKGRSPEAQILRSAGSRSRPVGTGAFSRTTLDGAGGRGRKSAQALSSADRRAVIASALHSKTPRTAERDCSHLVCAASTCGLSV